MNRSDKLEKIVEYAVGNGFETPIMFGLEILFDHSFAKAFYGDYDGCTASDPGWKCHLQQQVLADDPLIYAWEYLQAKGPERSERKVKE